jgi:hypothetical protein
VAVYKALQGLIEKVLNHRSLKRTAVLVQIFLQIKVKVLEDQVKLIAFRGRSMNYILEFDYIRVA